MVAIRKDKVAAGQHTKLTHIRKRGNSAGVNLSAQVLAISGFDLDSAVSIEAVEGEIIIKAAKPKITLESLLANSPVARSRHIGGIGHRYL
jgi:antitoxin component of MazEF toxin-antitoxin module